MADYTPRWAMSPAEKDSDLMRELGAVAAKWASIDHFLVELICRLLNSDAGEIIYFSLNSFKSRLDVITNLAVELMKDDNPKKKELITLLNRLNRLNDTRNELIHSAIVRKDGTLSRVVRRPGRKVPRREHPVSKDDLERHGAALVETALLLKMLMDDKAAAKMMAFEIPASADTSPEKPPEP